jgi:predicted enzyme related to lactoylglutathione lyase
MFRAISGNGGEIVEGARPEGNLRVGLFRDPAGNVLGLWQATETDTRPDPAVG